MDPDQRCPTFQSFRGPNFCGQSDDNSEWHSEGFEVSIKYLDIYGKYVTISYWESFQFALCLALNKYN